MPNKCNQNRIGFVLKNLIFTLIFIFSSNFLFAKELEATFSFFASSGVTNIAKDKQNLYLATNDGFVDIFNLEKKRDNLFNKN